MEQAWSRRPRTWWSWARPLSTRSCLAVKEFSLQQVSISVSLTAGVAAGLVLSGRIQGGRMDWARAFAAWRPHEVTGVTTAIQASFEVGFHVSKGRLMPIARLGTSEPSEGGTLTGPTWHLKARCAVDGVQHEVSPECPHPGGIVNWNEAAESWDRPLHGSRLSPDGTLLEGPAHSRPHRILVASLPAWPSSTGAGLP